MRGTRLLPVKGRCPSPFGSMSCHCPSPHHSLLPVSLPDLNLSSPSSGHWAPFSDLGNQETFPAQLSLSMVLCQYLSWAGCPKCPWQPPPFLVSILSVGGLPPDYTSSFALRPYILCFKNPGTQPPSSYLTFNPSLPQFCCSLSSSPRSSRQRDTLSTPSRS